MLKDLTLINDFIPNGRVLLDHCVEVLEEKALELERFFEFEAEDHEDNTCLGFDED